MKTVVIFLLLTGTGIYFLLPRSNELEPEAFSDALKLHQNKLLIDLRPCSDFCSGHIPGATNIDYSLLSFKRRFDELDSDKPLFIYCQNGELSVRAAVYLESQGFHSVTLLKGGIQLWKNEGFQLTPQELVPPTELNFGELHRILEREHFVLVDFYVPGDSNCRIMDYALDELSLMYRGKIKILRIDINRYNYLATEMGISSIPTLHFYENGKLRGTLKGVYRKEYIDEDFELKENSKVSQRT